MSTPSIPIYFLRGLTAHAGRLGVEVSGILAKHRVPPRLLAEENSHIAVPQFADIAVSLMRATDDESIGHLPGGIPIGSWHMMGHATITANTTGDCLLRVSEFYQLINRRIEGQIERNGTQWIITLRPHHGARGIFYESWFFCIHRYLSWFAGQRLPIDAVFLPGEGNRPSDSANKLFPGAPIYGDSPNARLVFPSGAMALAGQRTPDQLRRFMRHPLLTMLTERQSDGWTAKVRAVLRGQLDAMPELTAVADILGVHPQTLRRRLSAEGTSFTELKISTRRDIALHYLGKPGHSIEQIAYRAGFSEASAFTRAFKSWTGVTPYAYRKGLS